MRGETDGDRVGGIAAGGMADGGFSGGLGFCYGKFVVKGILHGKFVVQTGLDRTGTEWYDCHDGGFIAMRVEG